MITRAGLGVSWSSYNYPLSVSAGSGSTAETVTFSYGPARQRWQQVYTGNGTTETTNYIGSLLEQVVSGTSTDYRHYVYAGSEPIAVYSRTSSGTNTWSYLLSDHQGSVASITNSAGASMVAESFTAFGNRRNAATWSGAAPTSDLTASAGITRQGYTFQTSLGLWMGLNHMNGRVQDALTGRFLSPDPTVTDPTNPQDYNRYSYVRNNPLSSTDPTGFAADPPKILWPEDLEPLGSAFSGSGYNEWPGVTSLAGPQADPRDVWSGIIQSDDDGSSGGNPSTATASPPQDSAAASSDPQTQGGCPSIYVCAPQPTQSQSGGLDGAPVGPFTVVGPQPGAFAPGTFLGNLAAVGALFDQAGITKFIMAAAMIPAVPEGVAAEGLTGLRFAQTTASPFFSAEGTFAGQSIADVAGALRSGALSAADVPVQVVTMDGTTLIVNTRSSLALMQAGIPTAQWALVDMTGDAATEALMTQRLLSNGLSTVGTGVLRITGSGPNVSTLIPRP